MWPPLTFLLSFLSLFYTIYDMSTFIFYFFPFYPTLIYKVSKVIWCGLVFSLFSLAIWNLGNCSLSNCCVVCYYSVSKNFHSVYLFQQLLAFMLQGIYPTSITSWKFPIWLFGFMEPFECNFNNNNNNKDFIPNLLGHLGKSLLLQSVLLIKQTTTMPYPFLSASIHILLGLSFCFIDLELYHYS